MAEPTRLTPEKAAKFVLDDIRNDSTKSEAFERISRAGPEAYRGKRILEEVYGLPERLVGEEWAWQIRHKLFDPLGFRLSPAQNQHMYDAEREMLEYLGQAVTQPVIPSHPL